MDAKKEKYVLYTQINKKDVKLVNFFQCNFVVRNKDVKIQFIFITLFFKYVAATIQITT